MQHDTLDFSPHTLAADAGIKKIYDHLLRHQYDEAMLTIDEAITELRLAKAAVRDIKEKRR